MSTTIRWDRVRDATKQAEFEFPDDPNVVHQARIQCVDNNRLLTDAEKEKAKDWLTKNKDRLNLLYTKGPTYLCNICGKSGFTIQACELCVRKALQENFSTWTSGNNTIDKAIRDAQTNFPLPGFIIEWIEYENLVDIKYLTKGGYSKIYTATWTQGSITSFDSQQRNFIRSDPVDVILKDLPGSNEPNERFLKELMLHLSLFSNGQEILVCWGVTKNPTSKDYMLVLDRMEGDLRSFIRKNYSTLTWALIYKIFYIIMVDICNLHKTNIVHKDLHSGNILQISDSIWRISDVGLSGPADKPVDKIYGNMAYLAPEVFQCKYTKSSDIYSIGMLMYEVATGKVPFFGLHHDGELAFNIVNGIRPILPDNIEESYMKMICKCWNACPDERPSAEDLLDFFRIHYQDTMNTTSPPLVSTSTNPWKNYRLSETCLHQQSSLSGSVHSYESKSSLIPCYQNLPEPRNATKDEQEAFDSGIRSVVIVNFSQVYDTDEYKVHSLKSEDFSLVEYIP